MAAGKGTRMKSARPKVLHRLAGKSLLQHVLDAVAGLAPLHTLVITGHGAETVETELRAPRLTFVRQEPQLGTGHAVQQVVPHLANEGTTLILNGDVPLIRPATAAALAAASGGTRLALLTIELADATGYGRIVRGGDSGDAVTAIVEHKDANPAQRAIREVYTGMLAAPTAWLKRAVMALKNDNAQREYYLTDIVAMAVADGVPVVATQAASETEVLGVNSPVQLADLERRYQRARAEALMEGSGVRFADPARFDVRGTLSCGSDVEIDVGCVFEGDVTLADNVKIGAHCVIRDAQIDAGAVIHPFTHIEGAHIGTGALIGPYARLRPGADLGPEVHIGNFVEVKNSTLGQRRQGQPPGLPRRRDGRRARQLRRRQHHRQLRRRQQASHADRCRCAHRQQLRAGGAVDDRRRRHHRRRLDDRQGRAGRAADRRAGQAGVDRRMEAAEKAAAWRVSPTLDARQGALSFPLCPGGHCTRKPR